MADNVPQSSFIPKQGVRTTTKKRSIKRVYILSYIAFSVFIITVLTTLAVVVYKIQVEQRKDEVITQFIEETARFDDSLIVDTVSLEQQLTAARGLLNRHIALTDMLSALEDTVTDRITYNQLTMERQNDTLQFTFGGTTNIFDAVAFQDEVLAQNSVFNDVEIDSIAYTAPGFDDEGERVDSNEDGVTLPINFSFVHTMSAADINYSPESEEVNTVETTTSADSDVVGMPPGFGVSPFGGATTSDSSEVDNDDVTSSTTVSEGNQT